MTQQNWFAEKSEQIVPATVKAFGISCFSRYSQCDEMIRLLAFAEASAKAGVNGYVTEAFFDSKACIINVVLNSTVVKDDAAHQKVVEVGKNTLGHFMIDGGENYYSDDWDGPDEECQQQGQMNRCRFIHHPATDNLADRLSIATGHAIGILMLLENFQRTYAPDGRIGKWTDKDIARACDLRDMGCPGEAIEPPSPAEFVDMLVECGWLTRHPEHRLVYEGFAHPPFSGQDASGEIGEST